MHWQEEEEEAVLHSIVEAAASSNGQTELNRGRVLANLKTTEEATEKPMLSNFLCRWRVERPIVLIPTRTIYLRTGGIGTENPAEETKTSPTQLVLLDER